MHIFTHYLTTDEEPANAPGQVQYSYGFDSLPPELEAHEPPEARGLGREDVHLMVSYVSQDRTVEAYFRDIPDYLSKGDVLVLNTSGTIKAAVHAVLEDGTRLELHFSSRLSDGHWIVELRQPGEDGTVPFFSARASQTLSLPGNARVILVNPYRAVQSETRLDSAGPGVRLWVAQVQTPLPMDRYLDLYGFPIRYKHIPKEWPISYYQTVYATEPGSAEMPSAGRAFTLPILDQLKAKGVRVVPLILHTGVASAEQKELPPPEYYRVPAETAQAVERAHQNGQRVIAVGTTVVRALETVTGMDGVTRPGEGWTELLVTPERGIRSVNGLLTGFHEPRSTHLLMLEALAGKSHILHAYAEAVRGRYLWHEFGDLHLILP